MLRRTSLTLATVLVAVACGQAIDAGDTTTTDRVSTTEAQSTSTTRATTTTTTADTTTVPEVQPEPYVEGADPEADAIFEAYSVVFDSTTSFDEKSPYIDDPSGLEGTVENYSSTGDQVGGVTAEVTAVAVIGDEAQVIYTLLFSGNPTYPDQKGTAVRGENGWQLSRDMFCDVMRSARSACPSE